MERVRIEAIQVLVEPILSDREVELVELTCRPNGRQTHIRLLVDKVGGITIQECATINRLVSQAVEAANLMEDSYTVEVSSPGLDRPLVNRRDFERTLGEEVWVDVRTADGRTQVLDGVLLAVQPEAVVLKTISGNVTIPLSQVLAAKKALRW